MLAKEVRSAIGRDIPWSKPEEHHRVELVDVGYAYSGQHNEQEEVPEDEVTGEHAQFRDLAEELTAWLGH